MSAFERIAEERIRQEVAEGKFAEVRGKGKPLHMADHPNEPEDRRLVNSILKSSEVTYDWLECGKTIDFDLEQAVGRLRLLVQKKPSMAECQTARLAFLRMVAALNRRILDYNGRVPTPAFKRRLFNADEIWQLVLKDATNSLGVRKHVAGIVS